MKKGFSALCILCCVILLSACNQADRISAESIASGVSADISEHENRKIDDLVRDGTVFRIDGLYGESDETLISPVSEPIYAGGVTGIWSTPVNILFYVDGSPIPYMYDKQIGTFSYACRDPLCPHYDCIWAECRGNIYCGNDSLYFVSAPASYDDTIYVGNLYGENLRKLYQSDGNRIDHLVAEGDFLYFLENLYNEKTDQVRTRLMRMPINGGRVERILEETTGFFLPMGDKILYVAKNDDNGYLFSLESGEVTLFEPSVIPKAVYKGWLYYNTDHGFYRASVEDLTVRETVFDHICSIPVFSADRICYLKSSVYSKTDAFGIYAEYDLYSADLDGSEQTLLLTFETDGIPDYISFFELDGDLLFVTYKTYRDFRNEFNPNGSRLPYRHALVNLATGERISF